MPRGTRPDPPPKYRLLQTSSGHFCTHPRRTVKPCACWRAGACQPMGADAHARVLGLRHIGRCPLTWHRATTDVRLPDQARERPHRGCGQPADALVAGPPVVQRPLAGGQAAWHSFSPLAEVRAAPAFGRAPGGAPARGRHDGQLLAPAGSGLLVSDGANTLADAGENAVLYA